MIQGEAVATNRYQPVVGLEVHCQLLTEHKLFCGCSTTKADSPNQNTCAICLGLPGVLPVLRRDPVELGIRLALAVGAEMQEWSVFARKHYFYPDLPKGYQITQYDRPYCRGGFIRLQSGTQVRLSRIHLEEDAGKSIHEGASSYIDYNRAGVPLLEIVSEPCISEVSDAVEYLRTLHSWVRALGVSDGNMEEGNFRVDVNVSLRLRGASELGTRCEIKNLNSFRHVERALSYEILRQQDLLESGSKVDAATLLFDPASGKTQVMRIKEASADYRYLDEPDLNPLRITRDWVDRVSTRMPTLPEVLRTRLSEEFGLQEDEIRLVMNDPALTRYYLSVAALTSASGLRPRQLAGWILGDLMAIVRRHDRTFDTAPIPSEEIADLLCRVARGELSGKLAKEILSAMAETGDSVAKVLERSGLSLKRASQDLVSMIDDLIRASPAEVAEFRKGKAKVLGHFMGQIMRQTRGQADPQECESLLLARLKAAP